MNIEYVEILCEQEEIFIVKVIKLAKKSDLPLEVYTILSKHKDSQIRETLSSNPNIPECVGIILSKDTCFTVRNR